MIKCVGIVSYRLLNAIWSLLLLPSIPWIAPPIIFRVMPSDKRNFCPSLLKYFPHIRREALMQGFIRHIWKVGSLFLIMSGLILCSKDLNISFPAKVVRDVAESIFSHSCVLLAVFLLTLFWWPLMIFTFSYIFAPFVTATGSRVANSPSFIFVQFTIAKSAFMYDNVNTDEL